MDAATTRYRCAATPGTAAAVGGSGGHGAEAELDAASAFGGDASFT
jgi:hypothetical protein